MNTTERNVSQELHRNPGTFLVPLTYLRGKSILARFGYRHSVSYPPATGPSKLRYKTVHYVSCFQNKYGKQCGVVSSAGQLTAIADLVRDVEDDAEDIPAKYR